MSDRPRNATAEELEGKEVTQLPPGYAEGVGPQPSVGAGSIESQLDD